MELVIIAALSLLLVPLVAFTSGALRIAVGLAFVLFFSGYTMIAALFPRKGTLNSIERIGLSFGSSIAVVMLIGLMLNYTPWGIRLQSIVLSLLIFILAMVGLALYRRWRLPSHERYEVKFKVNFSRLLLNESGWGHWDKLLTALLAIAVAGTLGTLIYISQTPRVGRGFTEFYILGPEGKAENYPREVILGENGRVLLGIVNQEHETVGYWVEICIDGEKVEELGPMTLNHEDRWEWEVAFIPARAGPNQRVEFLLYKGVESELYRTLRLWIDVKEES